MILAFVMLFAGGMLAGGAYSFFRSRKPWWSVALLGVAAVVCLGVSIWRIQVG
jgi:negative regulator of sigma E activity